MQIPDWITPPEPRWMTCTVEGVAEPQAYAVQIPVNGHAVAAVVPRDTVQAPALLPAEGWIQVLMLARLREGNVLAQLPAAPVNGTQRISVPEQRLSDAPIRS